MKLWVLSLLTAAALIWAFFGDGGRTSIPQEEPTGDQINPAAVVAKGVKRLRNQDSGRFGVRAFDGLRAFELTGVYRVQERAHRTETTLVSGPDTAKRISILNKGVLYVELTDSPADADQSVTCWGVGEPAQLRRFDGALEIADARGLPPALLAAGTARGSSLRAVGEGDEIGPGIEISGTVDLAYAMAVFGADRPRNASLTPGQGRVAATLRVEDKVLTGFSITGADLEEATRRTGSFLSGITDEAQLEADFFDTGQDVNLELPREDRQFDLSRDSGLLGLRNCLAERVYARDTAPVVFVSP